MSSILLSLSELQLRRGSCIGSLASCVLLLSITFSYLVLAGCALACLPFMSEMQEVEVHGFPVFTFSASP